LLPKTIIPALFHNGNALQNSNIHTGKFDDLTAEPCASNFIAKGQPGRCCEGEESVRIEARVSHSSFPKISLATPQYHNNPAIPLPRPHHTTGNIQHVSFNKN